MCEIVRLLEYEYTTAVTINHNKCEVSVGQVGIECTCRTLCRCYLGFNISCSRIIGRLIVTNEELLLYYFTPFIYRTILVGS